MRVIMVMAALALSGCFGTACTSKVASGDVSTGSVNYLCVGMEHSERFGACPGCAKDANSMYTLMHDKFGYSGEVLISAAATKDKVVQLLKDGIEQTPENGLFLFFYSGHGGQEYLGGEEPDGADTQDEYLCLYDTYMLDDEIWNIVSKCKGRVFLYFDACHSATMYRSIASDLKLKSSEKVDLTNKKAAKAMDLDNTWIKSSGFTFRPEKLIGATALASKNGTSLHLLCWSGCKEAEYSYGSSRGGTLTQSVTGNWKKGISYGTLWNKARSQVVREQPGQNPVATHVGSGFEENLEAFK